MRDKETLTSKDVGTINVEDLVGGAPRIVSAAASFASTGTLGRKTKLAALIEAAMAEAVREGLAAGLSLEADADQYRALQLAARARILSEDAEGR